MPVTVREEFLEKITFTSRSFMKKVTFHGPMWPKKKKKVAFWVEETA